MADTDIVTVDEVKKQLNIDPADTSQDDELAVYVEAVTEVIEHITGPVVPRSVTEVYDGGQAALTLRRSPVIAITSVTESGLALTAGAYTLSAGILTRVSGRWSGTAGAVTVVYQAGRPTIPAAIKLAAKELAQVNFRPQLGGDYSPFDTDSPEEGIPGEVRLGFFVPNRVRELLAPHDQYAGIG